MKSLFFSVFLGAFLMVGCGGAEEPPPPPAKKVAKTAPPPKPPPPAKPAPAPEENAEAAPSGDCPAAMAEYEKFVDKYVSYVKKAADGDVSALADAGPLMSQADKAGKELAAAQGDLSVECLKKYNAINKKMTDAALEISNATPAQKVEVEAAQQAADKALEAAGCMEKCQGITDPMKAATCMQGCM